MSLHKFLFFSKLFNDECNRILTNINNSLETDIKSKLSTIAINIWSPYLPWGRSTFLEYPKTTVEPVANKRLLHKRYLSLFGRNHSVNHLFLEVENISRINVIGNSRKLKGPIINIRKREIDFFIPDIKKKNEQFIENIAPKNEIKKWINELYDDSYDVLYKNLIQNKLKEARKLGKDNYPRSFAEYVYHLITQHAVDTSIGLNELDEKWISRIQMTIIASQIWGSNWRSDYIILTDKISKLLELKISFTVTSFESINNDSDLNDKVTSLSESVRNQLAYFLNDCNRNYHDKISDKTFGEMIKSVSSQFSQKLGLQLIGEDHEGHPLIFKGILTPGLDSIGDVSSLAQVIHEIDDADLKESYNETDIWALWKAYYKSNDLYLSKENICLQFELVPCTNNSDKIICVPRNILKLKTNIETFLLRIPAPDASLLLQGFDSNQFISLQYKKTKKAFYRKVSIKGEKEEDYYWSEKTSSHDDWSKVTELLFKAYKEIRNNTASEFFKEVNKNLNKLNQLQLLQLFDGIVEVSRKKLGCLVFIGKIEESNDKMFLVHDDKKGEITRLGISLKMVSLIQNHFSVDFRNSFSLEAGMDGETLISSNLINGFQKGSIFTRKFVHPPSHANALLNHRVPKISQNYLDAWNQACKDYGNLNSLKNCPSVTVRSILDMQPSELISLGTRHRKASIISNSFPSVLAITCSSSGNIKIWIKGVPIVDIKPDSIKLIDDFPPPKFSKRNED